MRRTAHGCVLLALLACSKGSGGLSGSGDASTADGGDTACVLESGTCTQWTETLTTALGVVNAIWGTSADDVWAGGDALRRWNGTAWTAIDLPPDSGIVQGIWGSTSIDVRVWTERLWIEFGYTYRTTHLFQWDGAGLNEIGGVPLAASVSGTGPNDMWVITVGRGSAPAFEHWDGVAWREVPNSTGHRPRTIWARAPDDAWALADTDVILHWDGAMWSVAASGSDFAGLADPTRPPGAIWGIGSTDVWAVGYGGAIAHWNGTTWRRVESGTNAFLRGVWGTGANDVWTGSGDVLLHWDGATWTRASSVGPTRFWGLSPNDLWGVGPYGTYRWNGTSWRVLALSSVPSGIWASAPDDVWAVGPTGTVHWDGSVWTQPLADVAPSPAAPRGPKIWGSGADDVWQAGGNPGHVRHWDGSAWTEVPASDAAVLECIWGTGRGEVWIAGFSSAADGWGGTVYRGDASGLTRLPTGLPHSIHGIGGTGLTDVWVASDGEIAHWDGARWSSVSTPPHQSTTGPRVFESVWASSGNDVWFGGIPESLHWDGSAMTVVPIALGSIWGAGPREAWAVLPSFHTQDKVLRWDGTSWSTVLQTAQPNASFSTIGGSGPGDVWIAGRSVSGATSILHAIPYAMSDQRTLSPPALRSLTPSGTRAR